MSSLLVSKMPKSQVTAEQTSIKKTGIYPKRGVKFKAIKKKP